MTAITASIAGTPFEMSGIHSFFTQTKLPNMDILAGWSTWQYIIAALVGIVTYDQGES